MTQKQKTGEQGFLFEELMTAPLALDFLKKKAEAVNRGDRFSDLIKRIKGDDALISNVQAVLSSAESDERSYRIVLDSMEYASRSGGRKKDRTRDAIDSIKQITDSGDELPLDTMKGLTSVGVVFDEKTKSWDSDRITLERQWLNAENENITCEKDKPTLISELGDAGIRTVRAKGGATMSVEDAGLKQLRGVFIAYQRGLISAKLRKMRMLNQ